MPNTNYNFISDTLGFEGVLASNRLTLTRSGYNATGQVLPYGRPVSFTGNNREVGIPTATGATIAGILILSRQYEDVIDAQGHSGYPDKESVIFLVEGDILVRVEEDILHDDAVFFRHTALGANTVLGRFRNDADTATCDALPNSSFFPLYDRIDSAVIARAGELAGLSIRL
jgi:hypothetical protein